MRRIIFALVLLVATVAIYLSVSAPKAFAERSEFRTYGCWAERSCQTSIGEDFNDADMCWAHGHYVRVFQTEEDFKKNTFICKGK